MKVNMSTVTRSQIKINQNKLLDWDQNLIGGKIGIKKSNALYIIFQRTSMYLAYNDMVDIRGLILLVK